MNRRFSLVYIGICFTVLGGISIAQESPSSTPAVASPATTITVSTTQTWTDTKLDLHPGDVVHITATPGKGSCSPDGKAGSAAATLPLSNAAAGALIGKDNSDSTVPFLVGASKDLTVNEAGHLYLGPNMTGTPSCKGDFSVKLQVTAGSYGANVKSKLQAAAQTWLGGQFGIGGAQAASTPGITSSGAAPTSATGAANATTATPTASKSTLTVSDAKLDSQLSKDLDGVPRRVNDQFKNLGDMVNFVIIGSQDKVQSALTAAEWRVADKSTQEAVLQAVVQTYEKKDYLQMPMSTLYLYNRPQDFGYELADPYAMVASRHHFRIWKAPFTWDGQEVWVGAGTHDIGFEKDQRNGQVTHKIDPAVDGERDNIGSTLQKTGKVKNLSYYLPPNPVQETKNATGGSYHSDGRLLIVFLQ
jgi:hypothetical protein